jgi:MFS family permease
MSTPASDQRAATHRVEGIVVYAAGVAQGIALVTFPAASTIFTSHSYYHLSSTQYGALFLPQVIAAIISALLGGRLSRRFSTKRVYLAGLAAGLLSMLLLIASSLLTSHQSAAYALLLVATASLGTGFGLTVPALNTLAAAFHPQNVDRAILVLNALLGLGTVLAPLFVALFRGIGFWQGLPVSAAGLLVALLLISARLPLRTAPAERRPRAPATAPRIPARFWVYAGFATLYGLCETVNGNWAELEMSSELGASAAVASLALTVFWAAVTTGRVLIALLQRWLPARVAYHALPFLLAGAFVLVAALSRGDSALGLVAFGLAGLGCSALLPLTISFAQEELVTMSAAVTGGVIGFYQVGYGIAAFGVGPLLAGGATLHSIFFVAAILAALMGAGSFLVAARRPSPVSLHPRLGHGT